MSEVVSMHQLVSLPANSEGVQENPVFRFYVLTERMRETANRFLCTTHPDGRGVTIDLVKHMR